jgi:hypothetical protein
MSAKEEPIDRAVANLGIRNSFQHGERTVTIVCLVRAADRRPLKAPWWRGKEAYIVGADLLGNFFLRHCDGSIRYWDHSTQSDVVVAPSERDFVSRIK